MRVVITADAVGGVWHYATALATALATQHSLQVLLVVIGPQPTEEQLQLVRRGPRPNGGSLDLERLDAPLEWENASYRAYSEARKQLLNIALQWRAHVVHANEHHLGEIGSSGMPVIVVSHSDLRSWRAYVLDEDPPVVDQGYLQRVRTGLNAASAVVAPSTFVADCLSRQLGYGGVTRIIHNGVTEHPVEAAHARNLDVLMAGRLWDAAKNLACFQEAVAGSKGLSAVAAGALTPPGEPAAALPRDSVHYTGALPYHKLRATMGQSHILVSPALYDPFGLVVAEAALAGCCLLLSKIASYTGLWEDTALYFDPREAGTLRWQINKLLGDDELRLRLAERARERARRLYSVERMAAAYLATYQRLALRYGLAL